MSYQMRFGPFCLLPDSGLLLRHDEPVRLGSRAAEILVLLVSNAGDLVTKADIIDKIWPDTIVVEANLSVHMSALRRALDDDSVSTPYIVTVPGRGYRFVAPVIVESNSAPHAGTDSEVQHCGTGMCGTVIWANEKAIADAKRGGTDNLIGLQLFRDFTRDRKGIWHGRVFVPDINKTFSGTIEILDENTRRGSGCLLGRFACKSQTWVRVK
ncbi:winged helix-turn-helix domain-containing protein [Novosphingobium sp. SG720]|uniref:winged helix-turn-helix domain-containing protein n=1 Tax=Novosphingobium sp. SG720 TaxID=2586998 RepID=UPI0017A94A50|nr:winged helix-turn-helix domain-containing protein [Novosphingobium sp. SG720]NKJ45114.1 DNA-binding winged helix-turn-helix (wHTH) protein [Novosphingobium sp. SG720]